MASRVFICGLCEGRKVRREISAETDVSADALGMFGSFMFLFCGVSSSYRLSPGPLIPGAREGLWETDCFRLEGFDKSFSVFLPDVT